MYINRILTEVYWPNQDYRPKAGGGPDTVVVCQKGGSWNLPNLLAYLTTGEPIWLKHQKALDGAIHEAASGNLRHSRDMPERETKGSWRSS